MRPAVFALLAFTGLLLAKNGWATSLPIGGSYGNAEGCAFADTAKIESDTPLLLTPEGFSSSVTSCEFRSMEADIGGSFTADSLCSHEGEEERTPEMVVIKPAGNAAYTIDFPDGTNWGPLARCS